MSNLFLVNGLFFNIFTLLSLAHDTVYFLYFIMLLCCSLINIIVHFESLIVLSNMNVPGLFFKVAFYFLSFVTTRVVLNEAQVDFTCCLVHGSKVTVFDTLFCIYLPKVILHPHSLSSQVHYVVICILCLFSSKDISHDLGWQFCYLFVDYFFILNLKPQYFFVQNIIKSCMKMGSGFCRLSTFLLL